MQVKMIDAESIFRKLEFDCRPPSKHHVRGWFVHEGKKILKAYYSFGRGTMPARVGDKFRQSLKVNEGQFTGLRDCPMDKLQYIEVLKEKKMIV